MSLGRLILILVGAGVVGGLLALDLRCSRAKDEGVPSAVRHVREEMDAGIRENAALHEEQRAEQLRILRVMARRYVEEGKSAEARKVFAAIAELENARKGNEKK